MFSFALKQTFAKSQPNCRIFCSKLKFVKDQELKREANLSAIKEVIFEKSNQTNGVIDWNCLSDELSERRLCRKNFFEKNLMSAFLLNDGQDINKVNKNLFESITKFLKTLPTITDNIIGTSHYCHFVGHFHHFIQDSDVHLIRKTTDLLMSKYAENRLNDEVMIPCLIGLTKSSKDNFLHAIRLSDQLKKFNAKLVMQMIDSSVQFKYIDHSIDLLKKYPNLRLSQEITKKIVICFSESDTSFGQMIDLMNAFSHNLTVFDLELKPLVLKILNKFSYKTNSTFIAQNSLCLKCDQTLKGVSPEEQSILLKEFCSQVFNRDNDLLMKSFPEYEMELNKFNKFMQILSSSKGPLNIVIDGLNVAFGTTSVIVEDKKNLRQFKLKYPIEKIDRHLVETLTKIGVDNYSNILIVGRKHMKRWSELNDFLGRHKSRVSMFYTMNKTQDDCYMLYATLQNPNTIIVSNDFYRDYCDKMYKSGNLFERWLRTHKALLFNQKIVFPDKFEHRIHISNDKRILHLPFQMNESSKVEWICCVRP